MDYLNLYLAKLINRGESNLASSIKETAEDIGTKYLESFSFNSHEVGLLFGNIQSGKTSQTFGVITKAADLGFPIFLILTSNNLILQEQMISRVKEDLDGFCICDENDSNKFIENMLIKPTIIVIKKNPRILRYWNNIFANTGFMKGNPLFIVDDEADESSLNTQINSGNQSSINRYLELIKKNSSCSIYLQVTGTPQALLLQTFKSGWHPYFIYYFNPGNNYLGGNTFFSKENNNENIIFIDGKCNPERNVVVRHLTVSSQLFLSGRNVSNCIIHPSVLQIEHEKVAENINKEVSWCKDNLKKLDELIKLEYENLNPTICNKIPFENILYNIHEILSNDEIKVIILNGKHFHEKDTYLNGCNFIIGGNSLSRGVTFPALNTIYYTRTSKNPQADTMWQHSRIFGYDRDQGLVRIFIDKRLYKLFLDINSTNNSIITQVKKDLSKIKLYYPKEISPTRKNILDRSHFDFISGGTNYFASNPENNSIKNLSNLLRLFNDSELYYLVSLQLIKKILTHIIPSEDFKLDCYISIIDALISENPIQQGILIVRRNRNITQGTGALLSSEDWKIVNNFDDKVVLALYQINGDNGWKQSKLWVPNIKFPNEIIYYNIQEN